MFFLWGGGGGVGRLGGKALYERSNKFLCPWVACEFNQFRYFMETGLILVAYVTDCPEIGNLRTLCHRLPERYGGDNSENWRKQS